MSKWESFLKLQQVFRQHQNQMFYKLKFPQINLFKIN
jgi:hypothetical protein